jgi:hypothetical protein
MNANVRNVAWAIAEAWWRRQHRLAAGFVPEAESPTDYADRFWEGWVEEAVAALSAIEPAAQPLGHVSRATRSAFDVLQRTD